MQQQVRRSPTIHGTAWHGQDSRQPLTLLGDWNTTDVRVAAAVHINEATHDAPAGSPILSMATCDASNPALRWTYNSSRW